MNSYNEYEVYRTTTLGIALQESLDDMIQVAGIIFQKPFYIVKKYNLLMIIFQSNQLRKDLAYRVIKEFDKSINKALAAKCKNKIHFKVNLACQTMNTINRSNVPQKKKQQFLGK